MNGSNKPVLGSSLRHDRLVVPDSLRSQLLGFRGRVWLTKLAEALALSVVAVLLAFLTVYLLDRLLDTPRQARLGIFLAAVSTWLVLPWALHRWVWKNRKLEQLARLLRVREPVVGDQLLSVLELAENDSEQARSRSLCAAAIQQVAESARSRDFTRAAPPTWLRSLSSVLLLAGVIALSLGLLFPAAAGNAWARFSTPWKNTPRYTFTAVRPLAPTVVVPHGESVAFEIQLESDTRWRPGSARVQLGSLRPLDAALDGDTYRFELPPQTDELPLRVSVGDYAQIVKLQPKLRPELVSATARLQLPSYLRRPEAMELDVRSGVLTAVSGSQAVVSATASRLLRSAAIDEEQVAVDQESFSTGALEIAEEAKLAMTWTDHDNLAGREPFKLSLRPVPDEFPTVLAQDLPRQAVVLDSEQINFEALAADDFGIQRIGFSWKGLDDRLVAQAAQGERLLSAGGPDRTSMQVPGTFSAAALGIPAQPIEVRLWVEDYMPGHERIVSPPHVLYVLTAEEHAIWITSQLSKWHRESLDVRDKEMQLHETNKRLREMSEEELADDEMRGELRRQASFEAANGRRLSSLSKSGENLLRQASRNPDIGVGHLDRWAEMLQILNDIGGNRMPSVSDLLDQASAEKKLARGGKGSSKPTGPSAGMNRSTPSGGAKKAEEDPKLAENQPRIPSIQDGESSVQPREDEPSEQKPKKKKGNGSKLSLPITTLAGPAPSGEEPEQPEQEEEEESSMDQALFEQEELLAEFEKIADELNTLLANLEGSTLVKRLKAASREQNQVAEKIGSRIDALFGMVSQFEDAERQMLKDLSEVEEQSSQKVSYIMDDMQSYFERRRMNQFKVVLDDMKESQVLVSLQKLGEELPREHGLSIAQAEYWSDTLDRWAEDLVDPACSGQCPGSKSSDALPPSLILEVLKILESEVNLREATRVAEQAKPAIAAGEHQAEAAQLSDTQQQLQERTDAVVTGIQDLPEGAKRFGKEIDLLTAVSGVMREARGILAASDTGSNAIAAETEAIELLLQCKRINPKAGGGGGGSSPGGGGTGTTQDSALALLGSGLNQNERREARDVTQATGESGRVLPEEFRAGLDAYFERLEQGR